MLSSLKLKRQSAAQASGGISDDTIYRLFENVLKTHCATGKVLDFGAGMGVLSQRLYNMQMFELVTGVDIMARPKGIEPSVGWHCQDLNDSTDFTSESFSVVVSAEVIEHLENPRAVVREWFRLLKPKGLLLLSTPNNESLRSMSALIFRGHYANFGETSYPAHITPLLRKDLQRIMRETGFDDPQFYYTDHGMVPKCTRLSWQVLSFGYLGGLRFSDNVLVATHKP